MAKLKGGSYVAGSLTVEDKITAESFSTPAGTTLISASTAAPPTAGQIPKIGTSSWSLVDSIISETTGLITVSGALTTTGKLTGNNLDINSAATISSAGAIAGASLSVTGSLGASGAGITGDVTANSVFLKEGATWANFALRLYCNSALSANRTLNINVNNADRTVSLSANLTVSSYAVTLTGNSAGTSALTLPAGTTTINALTSGHALYASAAGTISSEAATPSTRGGTGLTSVAGFTLIYGSGAAALNTLAPNTTTTPKALMMTGTGSAGANPTWSTIPNSALQNSSITVNGVSISLGGTGTITVGSAVTHASGRTDSTAYPALFATEADGGTVSSVKSCAAVTIQASAGQINATKFNAGSARKLKKNIEAFTGSALEILLDTRICTFYYKTDTDNKRLTVGFIADDTHELLATKQHDSMDMASSIGVLIKAVQELNVKLEAQQAEITRLKQPFWKRWFKLNG